MFRWIFDWIAFDIRCLAAVFSWFGHLLTGREYEPDDEENGKDQWG